MKKNLNLVLCIIVAGLLFSGCDNSDYDKANNLVNNGKYDEAIAIYKELGD